MSGSQRAEDFIEAFNRIDAALRELTGLKDRGGRSFVHVLGAASQRDAYVKRHRDDLRQYAELRNAIVHGPQGTVIAEPLEATVLNIEAIADYLVSPPLVTSIMAVRPVTVSDQDTLATVVRLMGANDFSQLLVSSREGLGLINSEHIRRWLGAQIVDVVNLQETRVDDLVAGLEDDGLHCLPTRATVFDAMSVFTDSIGRGRERVYAIAVTVNGDRAEQALGIITPWDLLVSGAKFDV